MLDNKEKSFGIKKKNDLIEEKDSELNLLISPHKFVKSEVIDLNE